MSIVQILLLGVVAYVALALAAIHLYGIWGLLGVIVFSSLLFRVLKRLAGKFLTKLLMTPFVVKGAVLKDADARVLSITSAPAPQHEHVIESGATADTDAAPDLADDPPRDWYDLDVTITPTQPPGPMLFWEPSELLLVGPEARPDIEDSGHILGEVHDTQIWHDGHWQDDSVGKYPGPQRLKLRIGVQPDSYHLRFRYYLEIFGHIEIPARPSLTWQEEGSVG